MRRLLLCATLLGAALPACSPALDWREVRPDGSAARVLFPCQPKSQTRQAALAGARMPMTLLSCEADGQTFALAHAAPHLHPRRIWFIDRMPLAGTNKIDRQALKARARELAASAG